MAGLGIAGVAEFAIGQKVYSRLAEAEAGFVTGYIVRLEYVLYFVTWPDHSESPHYAFELSAEPNYGAAS